MDRLTKRDEKGRAYFDDDGALIRGANGAFRQKKYMTGQYIHQRFVALDKTIDRLAAYEDTGLEPSEINELIGDIEKMLKLPRFVGATADPTNEPLTLVGLQAMSLKEWVWIEIIHPSEGEMLRKSAYYQIFMGFMDGKTLSCGWPGIIHEFKYEDYGETWLAYHHKPEAGIRERSNK